MHPTSRSTVASGRRVGTVVLTVVERLGVRVAVALVMVGIAMAADRDLWAEHLPGSSGWI